MREPLKPGDRVRVYESTDDTGEEISQDLQFIQYNRHGLLEVGNKFFWRTAHPKQCRRLVPKRKEPQHEHHRKYLWSDYPNLPCPVPSCEWGKEHHNIGSKCTLPNCPHQHDPAPREPRRWWIAPDLWSNISTSKIDGWIEVVEVLPTESGERDE